MISSKIIVPVTIALACIVAVLIGINLAVDSGTTMSYTMLGAAGIFLLLFAREYWWLALFAGAAFGGYAYFGFKLYAHEVLFAFALIGLIPSLAIAPRSTLLDTRPPLPWYFYAFLSYLSIHVVLSVWWNEPRGTIEYGNIGRAYIFGIWPLLFVFLFRFYGRTSYFQIALYLLQTTYMLRALVTLALLYSPTALMLPGINFMLPGSAMGSGLDDLRWSGYGICLISTALLLGSQSVGHRILQFSLLAFSFILLLMGGGRVMIVSSILVVLAALLVARKWKALVAVFVSVSMLIAFLNMFPDTLYSFEPRWQRALSILILNYHMSGQYAMVQGSDIWHERLEKIGYQRWTESPKSILLGTGIIPWKPTVTRESDWTLKFNALLEGAADTGSYESALWTILAVTGIIGFGLCLATMYYFASYNIRSLIRDRLSGFKLTAAFLGSFVPVHWFVFCPRLGGYPGLELMFAVVAFYYLHDQSKSPIQELSSGEDDEGSVYSESALSR